jgi:hypothetical protein
MPSDPFIEEKETLMPRRQRRFAMARLRLLPGERELVRLRPSPGAWLGRHLLAIAWAAWGAALLWAPRLADQGLWAKAGLAFLAPAVVSVALFLPGRKYLRLGLSVLTAASCALVAVSQREAAISGALALSGLMAFLLTETDRRLRTYHLTNLRILHHGGLWEREGWTVHYDAVLDVDARQSPFGRLLGYGNLEPVLHTPKKVAAPTKRRKVAVPAMSDIDMTATPRMRGVGPFKRVRHLVACFIQDATATEYLRAEQDTPRRVADAIRALGGANVLRR